MTTIDDSAFENCPKLKKVIIPKSMTSISPNAFKGYKNLTIYYCASYENLTKWQTNWNREDIPVVYGYELTKKDKKIR